MLNWFAKVLLVSTSLSPILGAVAVNQYTLGKPLFVWLPWLLAALLLVFICWGLLHYAARAAQKHTLKITQFDDKDKEVLAFLLAYLLPFAAAKDMLADVHWLSEKLCEHIRAKQVIEEHGVKSIFYRPYYEDPAVTEQAGK